MEMPNFTQALYEARELSMERMQKEADELQSEGIVGARIIERSHGWGSHVIEFFAIGTAVVSTSAEHQIDKPRWCCRSRAEYGREDTDGGRQDQGAALPRRAPGGALRPFHQRVRDHEPEAHVYETVRVFTVLHALITFRARGIGSENVPGGPVILAPNHASFMDHFFTGAFIRRRVQFMAKSQLFAAGIPSYIFSHGGVFPVRRGPPTRRGSPPPSRSWSVAGRSACTAREGDRVPARSAARRGPGSAAWRSSPGRRWSRWRSSDRIRCATGSGCSCRASPSATASRCASRSVEHPTREEQQEAADLILDRIREMHSELQRLGHTGARRRRRARPAT